MELDRYAFVLLTRPDDPTPYPEDELDRIQAAHLAHLDALGERGILRLAGPFADQPDPAWRGLCIFACEPDEARALMQQDPAVRAGRLEVSVFRWFTAAGRGP